jgi:hypothetical protein
MCENGILFQVLTESCDKRRKIVYNANRFASSVILETITHLFNVSATASRAQGLRPRKTRLVVEYDDSGKDLEMTMVNGVLD